jgi:hypothetical protein
MEMGSAFPHLIINNNNTNNNNSCWLSDPLVKRSTHGGHDFYHRPCLMCTNALKKCQTFSCFVWGFGLCSCVS